MKPITTPCHNEPLIVITTPTGPSYLEQDTPDEILCPAEGCSNSWNADGTIPEWLTGKDNQ